MSVDSSTAISAPEAPACVAGAQGPQTRERLAPGPSGTPPAGGDDCGSEHCCRHEDADRDPPWRRGPELRRVGDMDVAKGGERIGRIHRRGFAGNARVGAIRAGRAGARAATPSNQGLAEHGRGTSSPALDAHQHRTAATACGGDSRLDGIETTRNGNARPRSIAYRERWCASRRQSGSGPVAGGRIRARRRPIRRVVRGALAA